MQVGDLIAISSSRSIDKPVIALIVDISAHKKTWHRTITMMNKEVGVFTIAWDKFISWEVEVISGNR